ncbi:hypothetical protein QQZ08_010636 [Neonectria magnoliae]|uniref:Uncharacterized protein n=1 Tax=Neonectria magnoliae TaxID=2732573 RepID=A0ABR1HFF7_9HYPO
MRFPERSVQSSFLYKPGTKVDAVGFGSFLVDIKSSLDMTGQDGQASEKMKEQHFDEMGDDSDGV